MREGVQRSTTAARGIEEGGLRRGVPGDWFVDPIMLGVPGVRNEADDHPLGWQADALCAETDPEAFFPEKGGSTREAKRVCSGCDVRADPQLLAAAERREPHTPKFAAPNRPLTF